MSDGGWVGVDLDGTLARYDGWKEGVIGEPITLMQARVREWLARGIEVRIMTARASGDGAEREISLIKRWCQEHLGQELEVTCCKDYQMVEIWDDRAVRVVKNTGLISDGKDVQDTLLEDSGDIGGIM